jgi:uncharacterized RDD family membrane protein YckC
MDKPENPAGNASSALQLWNRPSRDRRFLSALIDLGVWTAILVGVPLIADLVAHSILGISQSSGSDPGDDLFLIFYGIGVLCGNIYLAVSNGAGRSVGKAAMGLRLIALGKPYPAKPGIFRGLVRSALQAPPYMGAVMVLGGWHDAFAGTTIVEDPDINPEVRASLEHYSTSNFGVVTSDLRHPARISNWKIGAAVFLHLFAPVLYIVLYIVFGPI